ncbi:sensor histidine kinase N-terminal domain-containing protein [Sphaerotilus montanus]|uniref:histidine kinase n=1 Tax=Sphaerotilus montanus TaxID=522889 RepID=A0A7Y9UIG2_9BURK|nr:ATP-binding protein [Sphaerotilus montanus]NYG31695.1 two-component system OmpR family sensor kinase [Sphaerotilus montanus]NZD56499.1 sensor histidine kinase N-terminal domain-containing protein [Sphaerotilus montanus]
MTPDAPPPATQAGTAPAARHSLESRLHVRLLLVLGMLWLVAAAVAIFEVRKETNEVLDLALAENAERLLTLLPLHLPEDPLDADRARIDSIGLRRDSSAPIVVYQVLALDNRVLLRSSHAPTTALAPGAREGMSLHGDWRVATVTHQGRRAQFAEAVWHRKSTLEQASVTLLIPLLLLLPLAAMVLHQVVRKTFRQLQPVQEELARRSAHDLQPVSLQETPIELHPLMETVNGLMARVQALLAAERSFSAKMAHELRTPLAAARAQAQRLAQETEDERARERSQTLVRQLDRLTHLATRLLQIARVDSGVALQRQSIDLRQLAQMVVDEFPQSRDNTHQLRLITDTSPARVMGDIDALGIAVRNLIDNALKHAGGEASVVVRVLPDEISVTDDGPGAPGVDLAALTRPFERGSTLARGSGLGLSLVQTIARQSGAELLLTSPVSDGRGWRACLWFKPPA